MADPPAADTDAAVRARLHALIDSLTPPQRRALLTFIERTMPRPPTILFPFWAILVLLFCV
jgi:hypothetical protein